MGRPAPYTAKVISLKAKELQPPGPRRRPLRFSHHLRYSVLHLTGLTTLIMAPTFLSFALEKKKGKEKLSQLDHCDSPGCCILSSSD